MAGITDVTAAVEAYAADLVAAQKATDGALLAAAEAKIAELEAQLNPAPPPPPKPPPTPPPPAPPPSGSGVKDFFGISTHTTYRTSPQYGNDAKTLELTVKAKASYIRDLLSTSFTGQDALWRQYKAAGIKGVHATVGIFGTSTDTDKPALAARIVKSTDLLVEVTGWNEPDGKGSVSQWLAPTAAWQKWLYQTVKGNPATAHIKVGLGALRGANSNGLAETGQLINATAGFFDFVDLHCYPGPTADVVKTLDSHLAWAHGHPAIVSEFGGSTANMSLADQARVLSTGAKYLAGKGIRFYAYELWDDPDPTGKALQSNFGLYESDGTDKPAVAALRALVP